ncbi:MAG: ATP-dependent Clp protease adapter ClpS [Synechococcaceae cyanobacterium RM1_1_27]|nr:ATP-dependent Clp protease adapter ClpS [Synechococcaceae cyanobacterium SM2_3_2]NJO86061.1 ATP-dependent Clp protease adapter ClpS [Synechococcaceae cyanobacterium RM1_1_27]
MSTQTPTKPSQTQPTRESGVSTVIISKPYPNFRIIVLNDDFNTFQHVTECLMRYIPGMTAPLARKLTEEVHYQGRSVVWSGPQEQAELYHLQLSREGLTMAPLEAV